MATDKHPSFTTWARGVRLIQHQDPSRFFERYRKEVLEPLKGKIPVRRQLELEKAYYGALYESIEALWSAWTEAAGAGEKQVVAGQKTAGGQQAGGRTVAGGQRATEGEEEKKAPPGPWKPFDGKHEYGDPELRSRLPLKAAKTEDKPLVDGMRPVGPLTLGPDTARHLKAGPPGSVWLGFVQLGRRTGGLHDVVRLVPYLPRVAGPEQKRLAELTRAPQLPVPLDMAHAAVINLLYNGKAPLPGWALDKKHWNGIAQKKLAHGAHEAGCFFGFYLVLGEPKAMPLVDFRSEINRAAGAKFCDAVPERADQLSSAQGNAWTQYRWHCRYPEMMTKKHDEGLARALQGVPLRRDVVAQGPKRMPLLFARGVVEALQKVLRG